MMATYLDRGEGKALVPKVASVFEFEILRAKGGKPEATYTIDLKNGQGKVTKGKGGAKADANFTMTDDDFEAVCQGKLNP
jgi:3-hydroxyacyl-CoA dehydrogenase/3a,7a,12a-trihydroxy-5b-cholest-24-enoyl-CoA hydratase